MNMFALVTNNAISTFSAGLWLDCGVGRDYLRRAFGPGAAIT